MSIQLCVYNPQTTFIDVIDSSVLFSSVVSTNAVAGVDIPAGSLVHIQQIGQALVAVLADSEANTPAVGIVGQYSPAGSAITITFSGLVSRVVGSLSPSDVGSALYLSTMGGVSTTPGTLRQSVGILVVAGTSVATYIFSLNPSNSGGGSLTPVGEYVAGVRDGVNTTFLLSSVPLTGSLILQSNEQVLTIGVSYSVSGRTITWLTTPPLAGDSVYANYFTGSTPSVYPNIVLADTDGGAPFTLFSANGQLLVAAGGTGAVANIKLTEPISGAVLTVAITDGQIETLLIGGVGVASVPLTDTILYQTNFLLTAFNDGAEITLKLT